MKKPLLVSFIALVTTLGVHAQTGFTGTVTFDNGNANPAATLASSTFGMVFIGTANNPIPLDQDINVTLLGGSTAGSLSLIDSLTFANGLAQGDNTFLEAPGVFLDLTGSVYQVPGFLSSNPVGAFAYFKLEAWFGKDATYENALADGSPTGNSGAYLSELGGVGSPPSPPASIGDGMPSFLVPSPEPGTLALFGLGAASLLLFRRKKS